MLNSVQHLTNQRLIWPVAATADIGGLHGTDRANGYHQKDTVGQRSLPGSRTVWTG